MKGEGLLQKEISAQEAASMIGPEDDLFVGGFGLSGTPLTLIDAVLQQKHAVRLTVISNNLGEPGKGLGKWLRHGKIKKAIGSYFTSNRDAVKAWKMGEIDIELLPQGTLAEAIRAGGAGIGGFYTKTAVATELARGKEERMINGERYLFISPLRAKFALIKARYADSLGNLIYAHTARNFNSVMATAADIVIAEVDEIVPVGSFAPAQVETPHLYIDYLVRNEYYEKKGGRYVAKNSPG